MSDSVDILKKLALQVRNASVEGENTAERIGRIFIGILENMDNSDIEKLTKYFLRKDKEDTANELITFLKGFWLVRMVVELLYWKMVPLKPLLTGFM
jgi:hypothetical protein